MSKIWVSRKICLFEGEKHLWTPASHINLFDPDGRPNVAFQQVHREFYVSLISDERFQIDPLPNAPPFVQDPCETLNVYMAMESGPT